MKTTQNPTMSALQLTAYKQPLMLNTAPMPEIGDDQVLVEVYASAINPLDFKIAQGELRLILPYQLPQTMGNDVAGKIVKIGKNVQKFQIGDEIYACPRNQHMGTFADFVALHQDDIAPKPAVLNFTDAAGVPLVALTAYQALFEVLKVQAGQKVLILAGSGGVGTIAIQMAKLAGCHVATTASASSADWLKSLGADTVIDYKTQDFAKILRDFDAVLDTQGGDDLKNAFKILKSGGKVVSVAGMPTAKFAKNRGLGPIKQALFGLLSYPIYRQARRYHADYEFLFMKADGKQLQTIGEWIQQGKLRPVTDQVFDFKDVFDALAHASTGRAKGKVVLKMK
ncbi:NADP-dependent oxidoreductase [Moraxella marmotae]|uniref:NADP-dependent oxidoreductase n=1 Tax=Moraxella marmotae TaxID=3344520 RepID=UPI0035F3580F